MTEGGLFDEYGHPTDAALPVAVPVGAATSSVRRAGPATSIAAPGPAGDFVSIEDAFLELFGGVPDHGDEHVYAARLRLARELDEGITCPTCSQHCKVYRRTINAQMARALIALYRACCLHTAAGSGYMHWPTVLKDAGVQRADEAKLWYWRLVEPEGTERDDGSNRVGRWRPTRLGVQFVTEGAAVARYALIYNQRLLGLAGGPISIRDALGERFDFDDLMRWRIEPRRSA